MCLFTHKSGKIYWPRNCLNMTPHVNFLDFFKSRIRSAGGRCSCVCVCVCSPPRPCVSAAPPRVRQPRAKSSTCCPTTWTSLTKYVKPPPDWGGDLLHAAFIYICIIIIFLNYNCPLQFEIFEKIMILSTIRITITDYYLLRTTSVQWKPAIQGLLFLHFHNLICENWELGNNNVA